MLTTLFFATSLFIQPPPTFQNGTISGNDWSYSFVDEGIEIDLLLVTGLHDIFEGTNRYTVVDGHVDIGVVDGFVHVDLEDNGLTGWVLTANPEAQGIYGATGYEILNVSGDFFSGFAVESWDGLQLSFDEITDTGFRIHEVSLYAEPVPEPSTFLLLGLFLFRAVCFRRC
ncbi:MAG: PEP-CTERM sorting domain-containing protein [Thermodesulfobacteriota bacterium]